MKRLILFFLPLLLFSACSKDFGTAKITYQKATAIYGNLEEIRNTPLVGTAQTNIENPGKIFVSDQFLLIGEEGKGIHVLDNTNAEAPQPLYFMNIPGNREFFVKDNIIYGESYYDVVKIDISNITVPKLVSRLKNAFLSEEVLNDKGEALIGFNFQEVTEEVAIGSPVHQQASTSNIVYFNHISSIIPPSAVPASFAGNSNGTSGTVNRISTYKDYVYFVSFYKLTTLKDNQNELTLMSSTHLGNDLETVFIKDDLLYIGARTSMRILSLDTPELPSMIGSFWHPNSCDPVYPYDEVIYLTLRGGDFGGCFGDQNALWVLEGVNRSNLINNKFVNTNVLQEIAMKSPYGMTMIGDKLYVGEGANGLKIFDATNRKQLSLLSWDKSVAAYDIIPHPSRRDLVLIAGPKGLGQYKIGNDNHFDLLSWVRY
jgi:hypothetical protein